MEGGKAFIAAAVLVALFPVNSVQADHVDRPPDESLPLYESLPLFWRIDSDGQGPLEVGSEVAGSSAEIWRHEEDGIEIKVTTSGLHGGHAYTVWLVVFNHPEACSGGEGLQGTRCGRSDVLDPATRASLMSGRGGKFVGESETSFAGIRPTNPSPCTSPIVLDSRCFDVPFGPGLEDALGAEIHVFLRDHGHPQFLLTNDQRMMFNGGCQPVTSEGPPIYGDGGWGRPGSYPCSNPQGTHPDAFSVL